MDQFSRTEILLGSEKIEKLKQSHIAVFGIGGVGSYVAEALARTGVGNLTLIDYDNICVTNINRQVQATIETVGQLKVDAMKNRLLTINPEIYIVALKKLYNKESEDEIFSSKFDYVVDAIDMVSSKLDLIEKCVEENISVISSMGAGNKLNPAMFEVSDIYKTSVCPLARVMRKELKNRGINKLKVVYSKEKPLKPNLEGVDLDGKRQVPGSLSFVPSVAGLIIASEVVKDICSSSRYEKKIDFGELDKEDT